MSLFVTCTVFFTRLPRLPCSTKERVALEERQAQLADAADARGQRERQERTGGHLQRQQEQAAQAEGQDAQGLGQSQHEDNLAEEPQLAHVQQAAAQQQRCAEQAATQENSSLPAAALPEQQRVDSKHPVRGGSGHGRPRLRQARAHSAS